MYKKSHFIVNIYQSKARKNSVLLQQNNITYFHTRLQEDLDFL